VSAHRHEAVGTEQRLLERAFPFGDRSVRDARELVDQRHDGPSGPPTVQMGGDDDAGERVHDQDVEAGGIQGAAEAGRSLGLLRRARAAGHDLIHLHPALRQPIQEAAVVQVAAGETARVPYRDEGDAQGQSSAPSRAA